MSHGQTTAGNLQARLRNKLLYLSGEWGDDKLTFTSEGVKLSGSSLRLKGRREGIEFTREGIRHVDLPGEVRLEIARPSSADYTEALNAIFFTDPADFVPTLPDFWQSFGRSNLLHPGRASPVIPRTRGRQPNTPERQEDRNPCQLRGGITSPVVLKMEEPEFTTYARKAKLAGVVLVYLQVSTDGMPEKVSVLRPLGLGLDEQAVAAVKKYSFQPAMQHGNPVAVEMNVEVNFQVF